MIVIEIANDLTGTKEVGNYEVEIRLETDTTRRMLSSFPIKGHTRKLGYVALLERVVKQAWISEIAAEDVKDKILLTHNFATMRQQIRREQNRDGSRVPRSRKRSNKKAPQNA